jgi:hypothetical protein
MLRQSSDRLDEILPADTKEPRGADDRGTVVTFADQGFAGRF